MKVFKKNPIILRRDSEYESLSMEDQERWNNINNSKNQLHVIKRKRKIEINVGDIFVLQPRENLYFYGKVIKTNIQVSDERSFLYGKQTVMIFKCKSNDMGIDSFRPNYDDLLIQPSIVDRSYWTQGYFLQ